MRVAILAAAMAALATTAQAGTACRGGVFDRTPFCTVAPKPPASSPVPSAAAQALAPAVQTPPGDAQPAGKASPAEASPAAKPAEAATEAPAAQPAVDPRSVPPYACNFAQQMTLGPAECQAREIAADRRQVGAMIAARRCDAAVKAARATGDADFAARVAEACAERIHAAPPSRAAAP